MMPGTEEGSIVIEDHYEQATAAYAVDPYSLNLYSDLVKKLRAFEAPIELEFHDSNIVLDGLRFVVREETNHPYAERAARMLDDYDLAIL